MSSQTEQAREKDVKASAFHEAGHVIAALAFGHTLRWVAVDHDGGAVTRTACMGITEWNAEGHIILSMAGVEAQRIVDRRASYIVDGWDDTFDIGDAFKVATGRDFNIFECVGENGDCEVVIDPELRRFQIRARKVIRQNRSAINTIANELRERCHMTGREVEELLATNGVTEIFDGKNWIPLSGETK